MPLYTLKLRAPLGDLNYATVNVPDQYHVGQMVTIAPARPLVAQGKDGAATIEPGESITGTVTQYGRASE